MSEFFTHDVFLSHSSNDKVIVRDIAERLKKDGQKVWFDEWVLKPGDSIPSKIEEGLEHSRVLVLCMSVNAFGSEWAQLESYTFRFRDPLNKRRRFIPVRLDDAPIKGSLSQFLYIKWQHGMHAKEYPKLLDAVKRQELKQETSTAESQTKIRQDVKRLVKARLAEWNRMHEAFEDEAKKFPPLSMSIFFIDKEGLNLPGKFPQPNHVINLWQYYGAVSTENADTLFSSAVLTRFGLAGAELTACALLCGDPTTQFRHMATRAGTLLPDSISHLIVSDIPGKLGDLVGSGKPIMTSNSDPLAKWLNMVLVATSTLHPDRLKDGKLLVDPFAASISVFDYLEDVTGDSEHGSVEGISGSATATEFDGIGRSWSGLRGLMQNAYSAKVIKSILGRAGLDMTTLGDTGTFKGEVLNCVDHLIQVLDNDARDQLALGCIQELLAHEEKIRGDGLSDESEVIRNLEKVLARFGFNLSAIRGN